MNGKYLFSVVRFMLGAKNFYQEHCVTEWVIFMVIYAIFNGFCLYLNRLSACEKEQNRSKLRRGREENFCRSTTSTHTCMHKINFKHYSPQKMSFFILRYEVRKKFANSKNKKPKICKRWQKSRFRTKTDSFRLVKVVRRNKPCFCFIKLCGYLNNFLHRCRVLSRMDFICKKLSPGHSDHLSMYNKFSKAWLNS